MEQYIRKLVDEGKVFPDEAVELAIPLIAEAGRRNPRAVVRLLNRIMVSSRISASGSKPTGRTMRHGSLSCAKPSSPAGKTDSR